MINIEDVGEEDLPEMEADALAREISDVFKQDEQDDLNNLNIDL